MPRGSLDGCYFRQRGTTGGCPPAPAMWEQGSAWAQRGPIPSSIKPIRGKPAAPQTRVSQLSYPTAPSLLASPTSPPQPNGPPRRPARLGRTEHFISLSLLRNPSGPSCRTEHYIHIWGSGARGGVPQCQKLQKLVPPVRSPRSCARAVALQSPACPSPLRCNLEPSDVRSNLLLPIPCFQYSVLQPGVNDTNDGDPFVPVIPQ